MKIEISSDEMMALFPHLYTSLKPVYQREPIVLNGVSFLVTCLEQERVPPSKWRLFENNDYDHGVKYTLYMERFVKVKSKEEIAAENAVQKAEEALKAAKSVLEKVKESK